MLVQPDLALLPDAECQGKELLVPILSISYHPDRHPGIFLSF